MAATLMLMMKYAWFHGRLSAPIASASKTTLHKLRWQQIDIACDALKPNNLAKENSRRQDENNSNMDRQGYWVPCHNKTTIII
jgi:hypothetical protein